MTKKEVISKGIHIWLRMREILVIRDGLYEYISNPISRSDYITQLYEKYSSIYEEISHRNYTKKYRVIITDIEEPLNIAFALSVFNLGCVHGFTLDEACSFYKDGKNYCYGNCTGVFNKYGCGYEISSYLIRRFDKIVKTYERMNKIG